MSLDGAAPERRGTIQSVDRAARILKVLGRGSARLGVTEISEQLGLAKGTAYGLLRTLEAQGMVEQDPDTDKYRLGPAMLQLGNAFLDNHELRGRSLLWADSLASRVGESVRVGVLNGSTVLIVHHVFRPDNSVQILEVGASIPWHACAMGRAIVAYLGEDEVAAMLADGPFEPLTGRTLVDPGRARGGADRGRDARRRDRGSGGDRRRGRDRGAGVRPPRAAGGLDRRGGAGGAAARRGHVVVARDRGEGDGARALARHGRRAGWRRAGRG